MEQGGGWSTRGEAGDHLGHTIMHSQAGVYTSLNVPRATEAMESTEVVLAY